MIVALPGPRLRSFAKRKGLCMTNMEKGVQRKNAAATMSGDPDRELELTLENNPSDKQAQADVGSDGSMDASDPPSSCQPGGNDPVPSNDFPQTKPE
jgi:hypothetical protein